jgi:hypothetical protein
MTDEMFELRSSIERLNESIDELIKILKTLR